MDYLTSDSTTKLGKAEDHPLADDIEQLIKTQTHNMTERWVNILNISSHTTFAARSCSEDLLKPAASAHIHRMLRTKQISERHEIEQQRVSLMPAVITSSRLRKV